MVFVWKTNIDIADKELGIVPPSTEGQSEVKANSSAAKTKSILKEKQKLQSPLKQMESLSSNRNGNKENDSLQLQENASKQQRKQNVGQSAFIDSVGHDGLAKVVQEELGKMSAKMDTLMKTLVIMEKRLSLVEDQVKLSLPHQQPTSNDML